MEYFLNTCVMNAVFLFSSLILHFIILFTWANRQIRKKRKESTPPLWKDIINTSLPGLYGLAGIFLIAFLYNKLFGSTCL